MYSKDTLSAFQALPPASLYDVSKVSATWLEVIKRSHEFLKSVSCGELSSSRDVGSFSARPGQFVAPSNAPGTTSVPISDQHLSLHLLLEISFQKGRLSSILEVAILLFNLWESRRQHPDHRKNYQRVSAPLVPFLRRVQGLKTENLLSQACLVEGLPYSMQWAEKHSDTGKSIDPNMVLLKHLYLPEREDVYIDIQQVEVVIMAHLNRLAQPLLRDLSKSWSQAANTPMFKYHSDSDANNGVVLFHMEENDIIKARGLEHLNVKQVACGKVFNVALTAEGKIFVFGQFEQWSTHGLLPTGKRSKMRVVELKTGGDLKFKKVAMSPHGRYFLALAEDGVVYTALSLIHI